MKTFRNMMLGALAVAALVGCGGGGGGGGSTGGGVTPTPVSMSVSSPVFSEGGTIPLEDRCVAEGGQNLSVPLYWKDYPADTGSFLIYGEFISTANSRTDKFTTWTVYNVPVTTNVLGAGEDVTKISGVVLGRNREGNLAYIGPCRTGFNDTYKFTVYALSKSAPVKDKNYVDLLPVSREDLEKEYKAYILTSATITAVVN